MSDRNFTFGTLEITDDFVRASRDGFTALPKGKFLFGIANHTPTSI
jgi:hypothetical protein